MAFSEKDCKKIRDIFESTLERSTLSADEVDHAMKFSIGDLIIHAGLTLTEANQFVRFIELEKRRHARPGFTLKSQVKESKQIIVECDAMCKMAGIVVPNALGSDDAYHPNRNDSGGLEFEDHGTGEQAGMIKSNLYSIFTKAQSLHDKIGDNDQLPEWVQEKIAVADEMIDTINDYLQYEYLREK